MSFNHILSKYYMLETTGETCPSGALRSAKPLRRARKIAHFTMSKKSLNLQIYSKISKTMKKLQRIPNTIVNISVHVIF